MVVFRKAKGMSTFRTDAGVQVVNGRLESTTLDAVAALVLSLVDGGRDVKAICDLAGKEGISEEKTKNTLKMLQKAGIIVGEGRIFPEDERIFSDTWGAFEIDYMQMDVLPRIHVVQEDSSFQKISFLPPEKRGGEDVIPLVRALLKFASRTPLIEFLEADTYLDSSQAVQLITMAAEELGDDIPHFFFELRENIFTESDVRALKEVTRTRITQGLSSRTLISQIFGEDALRIGRRFKLPSQDDNISIALRANETNMKELRGLRKVPGLHLFLMTEPDDLQIERLSRSPYYVLLRNSEKIEEDRIDTILHSNHLFFLEDDMYRVQKAMEGNYLPLTDCGAGKRKIAVTVDGTVYPCADVAAHRMYCLGNLRDKPIETILKGKCAQSARTRIRERFNKCAEECCLAYYCSGCLREERCDKKKKILSFFLQKN